MKTIESPVLLIFEIRNREKEGKFKRINGGFNLRYFGIMEHSEGMPNRKLRRNIFH